MSLGIGRHAANLSEDQQVSVVKVGSPDHLVCFANDLELTAPFGNRSTLDSVLVRYQDVNPPAIHTYLRLELLSTTVIPNNGYRLFILYGSSALLFPPMQTSGSSMEPKHCGCLWEPIGWLAINGDREYYYRSHNSISSDPNGVELTASESDQGCVDICFWSGTSVSNLINAR